MAKNASSKSSMASTLKAYSVPISIFFLAMFYQLFVLPRSFPPSHYDALGIKRYSSVEAVKEAYENISTKWELGLEIPTTIDFLKIRYAYELLTHPVLKRDYDLFGLDEKVHIIDHTKKQNAGRSFSDIKLPLIDAAAYDPGIEGFNVITSQNFGSIFPDPKPWLIQLYSSGSNRSAQFSNAWKRIVALLNGVANSGMVELGDIQLSAYFAERKPTGQPFFRNGIPSLIAIPQKCTSSDCLARFEGELSVDAVTDWFATTVLNLPRILYYSKESLVPNFLAKSGSHKVKVILFSKTGERASPFVRQAAKDYWMYASFACVLWREEESSFWWNAFEVESAPAIVFLKDPGLKPVVYHGSGNETWFLNVLEQNKQLELPQLRSATSMELGCDARGYSRAGYDTVTWYCAILVGRQSLELNKMRETIRRAQKFLSEDDELGAATKDESMATAATALRNKRLTFTWLDGEAQNKYCFFYVQNEASYETCGPRRFPIDVPLLLLVRYKRNVSSESTNLDNKPKSIKSIWQSQLADVDPASQLVVSYNGSAEILEIVGWISKMIEDGDSQNLPFYRTKTPELVPEDAEPVWSMGPKSIQIKQKIRSITNRIHDYLWDPRIGPALLLGALMSTGAVWWMRSQPKKAVQSNRPDKSDTKEGDQPRKRDRTRNVSGKNVPPSITDNEPKDAYQMPFSESDSE